MKKTKKSFFNMIFGLLNQCIILIIGLIVPRIFIVNFGSEVNGIQGSIAYIYTYIALLESGIGAATVQALFAPLAKKNRQQVNAILSATNIQYKKIAKMYAVCMVIFAIFYPMSIHTTVDYHTIFLMILLTGISSLMSFIFYGKFVLLLQADGCSFVVMAVTLFNYVLNSIIKIVLIINGFSIIEVYVGNAVLSLLTCIIYMKYRKKHYPWIDYSVKPNLLSIAQSKNVLVHQISNIVCNSTDVMVLTYVVGNLKLVSIYNLYTMIFDAVKTIIQNIFSSVHFIMGQTYNTDQDRYKQYHQIYEVMDFTVSFILYSVAYIMILPFMNIYTQGITDINYVDPKLPLLFVSVKLLMSAREPVSQLINYAGHFKKTQNRSIIEAGINLLVSVLMAYKIGIYGVLIGTIVALLYRTIDMYLYTSKRFLDRSAWYSLKQWFVYMLAFGGVVYINSFIKLQISGYLSFFVYAFIVGIILTIYYVGVTVIFYPGIFIPGVKYVINYLKIRGGVRK